MTERPTLENWLSIVVLGLIWGGTFMVVSVALRGYGPLTVACARTTLGALALIGLMAAKGLRFPRGPQVWRFAIPIGIVTTALPFFLLSWGQQYVPSAFAGLSMASLPLFVLPLAHYFSDEPMFLRRAVGVGVGFTGAFVLIGPGLRDLGGDTFSALGQIACVSAAISYAVGSILTRRAPRVDAITLSAMTLLVGTVALIPAMLLVEGVPQVRADLTGAAILFLGLIPTALATLIRVRVVQTAGSNFMTLVNYQVPIWSMVFGATLLGETLPARFFAALALILTGLAISQWSSLRAMLTGRGR